MKKGLVIELPEDENNLGVVMDATRLNKNWYKVCILCNNTDIITCKIKPKEDNIHFDFKDVNRYDAHGILMNLNRGKYVQSV